MLAEQLGLATFLLAAVVCQVRILALAVFVAELLAEMKTALKLLAARSTATRLLKMARLAVKLFFAASAYLVYQERAFGAGNIARVAVVVN